MAMCCPESMLLFRKAPGSKPPRPIGDWGLGQCQGIKNSQTSSTKTPLTPSLPSTVPLLLLFYILLALSLGQSVCVVLIPRSVTAELHAASFCVVSLTPLYLFITKKLPGYSAIPSSPLSWSQLDSSLHICRHPPRVLFSRFQISSGSFFSLSFWVPALPLSLSIAADIRWNPPQTVDKDKPCEIDCVRERE